MTTETEAPRPMSPAISFPLSFPVFVNHNSRSLSQKSNAPNSFRDVNATTNGTIDPALLRLDQTSNTAPQLTEVQSGLEDVLLIKPIQDCDWPTLTDPPPMASVFGDAFAGSTSLGGSSNEASSLIESYVNDAMPLEELLDHCIERDLLKDCAQWIRVLRAEISQVSCTSPAWCEKSWYLDSSQQLEDHITALGTAVTSPTLGNILATYPAAKTSVLKLKALLQSISDRTILPNLVKEPSEDTKYSVTLQQQLAKVSKSVDEMRVKCIIERNIDPQQGTPELPLTSQPTSDSCDTDDDEDLRYGIVRGMLQSFHDDHTNEWLNTGPIYEPRLRKDIRAWARLVRYGCTKLPDDSMLLHKDKSRLPRRPRKARAVETEWSKEYREAFFASLGPEPSAPMNDRRTGSEVWEPRLAQPFYPEVSSPFYNGSNNSGIWGYRGDKTGYSSAGSNGSNASNMGLAIGGKKRRLPRDEDGYPCTHSGCHMAFSRACDLSHHQRSHKPKDTLPYACGTCDKRFPYPKDLRRHEKTHRSHDGTSDDMR